MGVVKENTFAVLYQGNKAAANQGRGWVPHDQARIPPSEINSSDTTLPCLPQQTIFYKWDSWLLILID